ADGLARIHDAAAKPVRNLDGAMAPITAVALSADLATAAAGTNAGVVKLWNTADGADKLFVTGSPGPIHAIAFQPQNQ
ncbi:MAG TPA: hypothetical protein PK867_15110, partial [Pirellulales bacterium]|nr:hypothetical protein [Pirellulales bacterium]